MDAIELRNLSGCSLSLCKRALAYTVERGGDNDMAIAYLKAKSLAVKTTCDFDERVRRFMNDS